MRLAAAAALRPDLPSLEIELARLDEGAGEGARALAGLTALAGRLPDDPSTLIALGKLLHRLGRTDEALVRLRGALALRPQDPELKRYVDDLVAGDHGDPAAADELARRFAEEASALVPLHPPTLAATGDTAVVLLDRRVVRVHKNGLSRTFAQRVVQVLTERGAEDNKEFEVHYTPGSEEVDIRQARIYRRDARGGLEVLEATDRSDEDLSEPWYGLYYDNRAEVVRFEGLRPGDVVEIQYLVDDVSNENQMADYFGDLQYVAETIPKRRWDYTLIAPVGRPIHANVPRVRAARTEDHRRRRRSGLSLRRHRHRQGRRRAGHAGDGGDGALPARQHLRDLGRGRRLVLAPGRRPADRRRRHPSDGARPGDAVDERRGARARGLQLRRREHPLRRARVRHPRLQALQGDAGAGAPLRRLQGQGVAAAGAPARGRASRPIWCWCARVVGAGSIRSRPRWRCSITPSSTSRSSIAISTAPRSSPA